MSDFVMSDVGIPCAEQEDNNKPHVSTATTCS